MAFHIYPYYLLLFLRLPHLHVDFLGFDEPLNHSTHVLGAFGGGNWGEGSSVDGEGGLLAWTLDAVYGLWTHIASF